MQVLAVWSDQRRGVELPVVGLDALLRAERDDLAIPEEGCFDQLVAVRDETLEVLVEGLRSATAAGRERERKEVRQFDPKMREAW